MSEATPSPEPTRITGTLAESIDQAISNLRAILSLSDDPHAIEIIHVTANLLDSALTEARDAERQGAEHAAAIVDEWAASYSADVFPRLSFARMARALLPRVAACIRRKRAS